MAAEYPTTIFDTVTDDITAAALKAKVLGDATYSHTTAHIRTDEEIIATQTKIGTGSSTPTANTVLAGNGTGTSAWTATPQLTSLSVNGKSTISHSTNLEITTSTGDIRMTAAGGDVFVLSGANFKVFDAGNTKNLTIQQDGTNATFNASSGAFEFQTGSVGINEASPWAKLHVNAGGSNFAGLLESTDTQCYLGLKDNSTTDNNYVGVGAEADDLLLRAGEKNWGRLDSAGYLEVYDSTLVDYVRYGHNGTDGLLETNAGNLDITPSGGSVDLRSGTSLLLQNSGNTANAELEHDGTNTVLSSSSGAVVLNAASGIVRGGTSDKVRATDSTATKNIQMYHDDTNSIIESTSGDLTFVSAGGEIIAMTGAKLRANDSADTDYVEMYHDTTNAIVANNSGDIVLDPASGVVRTSANDKLRAIDSTSTKYTQIYHDSTNGFIATSAGDMVLQSASGTVRGAASDEISAVDSTTAKETKIYHDNSNGFLEVTSGNLVLTAATGIIRGAASDKIRAVDSTAAKNAQIYHNDTNGIFEVTSGGMSFVAANGQYTFDLSTADMIITNATSTGGTGNGYITLNVGGLTRYIRIYSTT